MSDSKTLALVMAGGAGGRMEQLTAARAKPALPYAGVYTLIDFPLSNCLHSGIEDVWILQQFHPASLTDYVSNGRPWDLDRTHGGLRVLHPHLGGENPGFHQGNADAIFRNRAIIGDFGPDLILVLSADHIYKLDYRKALAAHLERGADLTMVTSEVENDDPGRFGIVEVDDSGTILDYSYKPEKPSTAIAATEVFVFDAHRLLTEIDELAAEARKESDEEDVSLEDFGDDLLPRLVKEGDALEYRLDGYWRDVGTIDSYWRSHMELLSGHVRLDLDDPKWPIYTLPAQRPPAHVLESASVQNSLVSPGSKVSGRVHRSVIGPGVVVEEDAVVRDSVVLQDAVIRSGSAVETAIVDRYVTIGSGAVVGEHKPHDGSGEGVEPDDVAVVGQGARIEKGAAIPAGGRIDPQS